MLNLKGSNWNHPEAGFWESPGMWGVLSFCLEQVWEVSGWGLDSQELDGPGIRVLPSMIMKGKMGKHYDIVLSSIWMLLCHPEFSCCSIRALIWQLTVPPSPALSYPTSTYLGSACLPFQSYHQGPSMKGYVFAHSFVLSISGCLFFRYPGKPGWTSGCMNIYCSIRVLLREDYQGSNSNAS